MTRAVDSRRSRRAGSVGDSRETHVEGGGGGGASPGGERGRGVRDDGEAAGGLLRGQARGERRGGARLANAEARAATVRRTGARRDGGADGGGSDDAHGGCGEARRGGKVSGAGRSARLTLARSGLFRMRTVQTTISVNLGRDARFRSIKKNRSLIDELGVERTRASDRQRRVRPRTPLRSGQETAPRDSIATLRRAKKRSTRARARFPRVRRRRGVPRPRDRTRRHALSHRAFSTAQDHASEYLAIVLDGPRRRGGGGTHVAAEGDAAEIHIHRARGD